jgi:vitamin B12 transporter
MISHGTQLWGSFHAALLTLLSTIVAAHAQETNVEPVTVSADRLPDAEVSAPFDITALDADQLRDAPELRLDDILRAQVPGFSLFRRNSSRTANPTTQGVTLRNFGPSGAGRTLVLLDGIPLNDPFGGYVLWSEVPPRALDSVIVQPGGGAGLFGNAALAGTIFLISRAIDTTFAAGEGTFGNEETYELSIDAGVAQKPITLGIFAERFSTAGYPVIASGQRGSADTNASAESDVVAVDGEWQIGADTTLRLRANWFEDERNNGTRYTGNSSIGTDVSAVLTQKIPSLTAELQISAYAQHRKFSSTFSAINATRTVETPAQDQFDVPATAAGGALVWSMELPGANRLTLGCDVRWIDGDTNEDFLWNGSEFTRVRRAGGEQFFVGAFAEDVWRLSDKVTVVGAVRADHWELFNGSRKESDIATGFVRLDSNFPDRAGDEVNGRLGLRVAATNALSIRGAFYSGFRVPTLNELYRPFRVGNDVTEANPQLLPEHLTGGEIGADLQVARTLKVSSTAFLNRMTDAVGNVTIGAGPGTFNPGGFIPAGGVLRQRQNIDLVEAPGVEMTAQWQLVRALALRASYIFTQPTVDRAGDQSLEGKLLAQTPEHVATAGFDWNPTTRWNISAQIRYSDRQFEDDQNTRVLAPFTTVDLAASYEFSAHASAAVRVENLFNEQIQSGVSATGVVSTGAPRLVTFEFRYGL